MQSFDFVILSDEKRHQFDLDPGQFQLFSDDKFMELKILLEVLQTPGPKWPKSV